MPLLMRQRSAPVEDGFHIAQLPSAVIGINSANHSLSHRMRVIRVEIQIGFDMPVGADVFQGEKGRMSVAGTAGESEDLVVEGTAPLIPKVLGGSELQPVEISAQLPFRRGPIDELHEAVFEVHQVVDREPCVAAWSGQ